MFHLKGAAFDFYYESFAREGSVTDEAKCYQVVKRAFIDQFGMTKKLEDAITDETSAMLNNGGFVKLLQSMESALKTAGFNDAAKFGLLRQAVMLIPDLAQFSIYRGASTYDELRKAVKEYGNNRTEYRAAGRLLQRSTGE